MEILNKVHEDFAYLVGWAKGETNKQYDFDGTKGPVICIHGSLGGWTRDGIKKYMVTHDVKGSLLHLGLLVDNFENYLQTIDNVVKKYENPLIIGFSNGGFLALLYAQKYNSWSNIRKIITVGTPFSGIPSYLGLFGSGLVSVSKNGNLLAEIKKIQPPENKVLSLFAYGDEFTPNPQNIHLNWPTGILDSPTHGDIQNHSERIENILDAELSKSLDSR